MFEKKYDMTLAALCGAVAIGAASAGCAAPQVQQAAGNDGQSAALADSGYNSLINDPATGSRDWKSADPTASGIAYWHVGWVSKNQATGPTPSDGRLEYVLATGYDRVTQQESVEVIIPQSSSDVAAQFRSLVGKQLDTNSLAADVEKISWGLAGVLATRSPGQRSQASSQCVGGSSVYRRPTDLRTLRRCTLSGSSYDTATNGATGATGAMGATAPKADPIVVFLNIALDIAKTVQEEAHCDPSVSGLGNDYQGYPSSADQWSNDCSNSDNPQGYGDPASSTQPDPAGAIIGVCDVPGQLCLGQQGWCGADLKCREGRMR